MRARKSFILALLMAVSGFVMAQQPVQTITVKGVTFKMIRVQGGTFTMGATPEQGSDALKDAKPAHRVTLTSYYIGETEVTQQLWEAVMGSNPSRFAAKKTDVSRSSYDAFVADAKQLNTKRPGTVRIPTRQEWDAAMVTIKGSLKRPVEQVSWDDCQIFIQKLNQLTGKNFRLPTEAEWEFAARGGNKSRGYKYSGSNDINSVAWCWENAGKDLDKTDPNRGTHDVKTKQPNELGLYDMTGNVYEWCQDWYNGSYSSSSQSNPTGPTSGSCRVERGGSWVEDASCCHVARRGSSFPYEMGDALGLRLAL